jgi:hypothetical protein
MITTPRIDRTMRQQATAPRPSHRAAADGPATTTPTLPLLQDAWSRAIARVLARHR